MRVEYKKSAVYGDVIYPRIAIEEDRTVIELCNEKARPYAVIEFKLHRHSYMDADTIRKHIHFGKREKETREEKYGINRLLGKKRRLMIVKEVEFGVYLGNKDDKVLLPKKQVPKDVEVGDPVEVFLYKDSF